MTPTQQAQVIEFAPRALAANAWPSELGTTWGARSKREKPPTLCQHCHGAPGMVTTFADAPFANPEFDALLLEAGRFTWTAGPLTKGSNLCHGTAGNGYAFLRLYPRTNDPIWLERARQLAMTAIAVSRRQDSRWSRTVFALDRVTSALQYTFGTASQESPVSRRSTCSDRLQNGHQRRLLVKMRRTQLEQIWSALAQQDFRASRRDFADRPRAALRPPPAIYQFSEPTELSRSTASPLTSGRAGCRSRSGTARRRSSSARRQH